IWLPIGLAIGLGVGVMTDQIWAPFFPRHLVVGTVVGYATALFLILMALRRGLAKANPEKSSATTRLHFPSLAYMTHEAAPYFGYGSLYMILILLPHFFVWLSGLGSGQTHTAWVITTVEVGLTLSMPPLVLASGAA